MKNLFLALFAYAYCSAVAYAGDVTLTNTFSANQPARAGEVNQNFTDVKTAVDDNNSRISTLEGVVPNKQDRVIGNCAVGQSIRIINSDGTVTCEVDADTTYSAGTGLILNGSTFSVDLKPAFRATLSGGSPSMAANTATTILFDSESFDVGGDYDPITGTFTTPEAGIYQFSCTVQSTANLTNGFIRLTVAGFMAQVVAPFSAFQSISVSHVAQLSSGVPVSCILLNGSSDSFFLSNSVLRTEFSGFKIN